MSGHCLGRASVVVLGCTVKNLVVSLQRVIGPCLSIKKACGSGACVAETEVRREPARQPEGRAPSTQARGRAICSCQVSPDREKSKHSRVEVVIGRREPAE